MKKEEFMAAIRRDGGKFRADKMVIDTGKKKLRGNGVVRVSNGRFLIDVTLESRRKTPILPSGVFGRGDFWKIRGVIEDNVRFLTRALPHGLSNSYGARRIVSLSFSTNQMQLLPVGADRMTHLERLDVIRTHPRGKLKTSRRSKSKKHNPEVSFDAILPDFEIISCNSGTDIVEENSFLGKRSRSTQDTFKGEVPGWYCGLIQRDRDAHIHLRSKSGYHSKGQAEDERRFQAFLDALAFTHGQHAWPFSIEHRRDGKLIADRIHLHKTVAQSPHAPFSKRLAYTAKAGKTPWDFQNVLKIVYMFFRDSKQSKELTQLLYLCREAGSKNVPYRITLLGLCSLLESLVQAIYAERVKPKKRSERKAFEAAKREIQEVVQQKMLQQAKPTGLNRIFGILTNAEATSTRMKFDSVIEHLELKPSDEWRRLYKLWTSCRNPLSHRMAKADESEQAVKNDMVAESDIAGAINCLALKLMGYSGQVQRSTFEGKYVEI